MDIQGQGNMHYTATISEAKKLQIFRRKPRCFLILAISVDYKYCSQESIYLQLIPLLKNKK